VPELSRFYGIVIRMFFDDHAPPHFHAEYGSAEALVDIRTLAFLRGDLPPRARGLVAEWAALHQNELMAQWERAQSLRPLGRIAPLD
jgi:Domain of unknown function (DUF4160)